MNYKKAKIILKKLNTLVDTFESLREPLSDIEGEMLVRYAEEFIKLVPIEFEEPIEIPKAKTKVKALYIEEETKVKKAPVIEEEVSNHIEKEVQEEIKEEVAKPIEEVKEIVPAVEEEFDVPPVEAKKPKAPSKKAPKKKVLVAEEGDDDEDIELWSQKEFTELSEKLSFSPIQNIFKSISINERIFTTNELFGKDNLLFRSTLEQLEKCESFDEAVQLLKGGVAKDQKWESKKKLKKASQFMKLVQRRYL